MSHLHPGEFGAAGSVVSEFLTLSQWDISQVQRKEKLLSFLVSLSLSSLTHTSTFASKNSWASAPGYPYNLTIIVDKEILSLCPFYVCWSLTLSLTITMLVIFQPWAFPTFHSDCPFVGNLHITRDLIYSVSSQTRKCSELLFQRLESVLAFTFHHTVHTV